MSYNSTMVGTGSTYGVPNWGRSQRVIPWAKQISQKRTRFNGGFSSVGSMTKLRGKKTSYRKSFKQKVLSIPPAKHLTSDSRVGVGSDTVYAVNVTAQVIQGDSNAQRDGDAIFMEALKLKGHFESDPVSNAYKCRVLAGYSGEEFTAATFTATALVPLFFPASQNYNAIVNPKAFTCLYDTTMDLNSQVEGDVTIQSFETTIPLKQMFPYQASASVYGKTKNLYIIVVAYGVGLAVGVGTGTITCNWDLIFKNF